MDLMDLKPKSDLVEVMLLHPNTLETIFNDDKSEMTISIAAQHSREYKEAIYEQQDRRIKAMQSKGKTTTVSASDIEKDAIDLLAKITKSWDITYGGEKPKLTLSKAKEVYSEVFWLRNQVEEALLDSVDFMKA